MQQIFDKILENWLAKIICIFLAITIFLFYKIVSLDAKIFSVPLTLESDINFTPVNAYTKQIKLSVRGQGEQIAILKEEDFTVFLDLNSYKKSDTYTVPVQVTLSAQALKIDPLEIQIEPRMVVVKLEEKKYASLPIQVEFTGKIPDGYEVKTYTVDPASVRISGAKSIIEKTMSFFPVSINLNGRQKNFTETATLKNEKNHFTVEFPKSILCNVSIAPKQGIKVFDGGEIYYVGLNKQLYVAEQITPLFLELSGDETFLQSFELPNFAVQADCSQITKPGIVSVPVTVSLPKQISLLTPEPLEVTLLIEHVE